MLLPVVASMGCASGPRRVRAGEPMPVAALQALFRAEVAHDEGRSTLRLTLRRWRADRFELQAADALGRRIWFLAVAGEKGLWRNLREGVSCRLPAEGRAPLGEFVLPLPTRLLPTVLLGGLPVELPSDLESGSGFAARAVEFDEGAQRRWRVTRAADGELRGWRLSAADGSWVSWERQGDRQRLRSSAPALDVEWREAARGELTQPEPPWDAAAEAAPECGDETLP